MFWGGLVLVGFWGFFNKFKGQKSKKNTTGFHSSVFRASITIVRNLDQVTVCINGINMMKLKQ